MTTKKLLPPEHRYCSYCMGGVFYHFDKDDAENLVSGDLFVVVAPEDCEHTHHE